MTRAVCFAMVSLGLWGRALAETYHVTPDGNDSNSGTEAQPFRTIHRGASALRPGDTLLVGGGTYDEEFDSANGTGLPSGSSWSAPITLRAYTNQVVTLRPTRGACNDLVQGGPCRVFTFSNVRYIIIDGFVMDAINVAYDAVKFDCDYDYDPTSGWMVRPGTCAEYIRITNGEIKHAFTNGVLGGSNIEFANVEVHHNGRWACDYSISYPGGTPVEAG